jgi:hypothetical protein
MMFNQKRPPRFLPLPRSYEAELTDKERFLLTDLAAKLALSRAIGMSCDPSTFAKALGDDLEDFIFVHRVTGLDSKKTETAKDFLMAAAQELVANCGVHPAATEPAAAGRTRRRG